MRRSTFHRGATNRAERSERHGPRAGGEVSERQWQDILGVLKVQGGQLDLEYMRRWSSDLGVAGLLERSLSEVGLGER
jgi:hypothetical protein